MGLGDKNNKIGRKTQKKKICKELSIFLRFLYGNKSTKINKMWQMYTNINTENPKTIKEVKKRICKPL